MPRVTKELWEQVARMMLENEPLFEVETFSEDSVIKEFGLELRSLGYQFDYSLQIDQFFDKKRKFDKNLSDLAFKYYKLAKIKNEKNYFLGLLSNRKNKYLVQELLKEYTKNGTEYYRWRISCVLYDIVDKRYLNDYHDIVVNKEYGSNRKMLVLLLGKIKDASSIPILIDLLDDDDVYGHALGALVKYKDENLRKYFQRYLDYDVTWIRNTAKKGIRWLDREIEKKSVNE